MSEQGQNTPATLAAWYELAQQKDAAALENLIADGAVFYSPVVHKPQEGKAMTVRYLTAALKVLGNETFRYVGEWVASNSAVIEFNTTVDGIAVDGIDMITWNADGKIVEFKVMIRPLKAIQIVMQKMGEELAKAEE